MQITLLLLVVVDPLRFWPVLSIIDDSIGFVSQVLFDGLLDFRRYWGSSRNVRSLRLETVFISLVADLNLFTFRRGVRVRSLKRFFSFPATSLCGFKNLLAFEYQLLHEHFLAVGPEFHCQFQKRIGSFHLLHFGCLILRWEYRRWGIFGTHRPLLCCIGFLLHHTLHLHIIINNK